SARSLGWARPCSDRHRCCCRGTCRCCPLGDAAASRPSMMGHGHAVMGAAAWVTLTAPILGGVGDLSTGQVLVGAVVTAGAGLLPDADHQAATISHSLPPIPTVLTRVLGWVSGGHRQGTHSILGIVAFTAAAVGLATLRVPIAGRSIQVGAWAMVLVLVAFAAKALRLTRGWVSCWAIALCVSCALIWFAPQTLWWLPDALAIGSADRVQRDLLCD